MALPGLIKAYGLNGHAYVSKSQLCLATRDHKDTKPINKWLDAVEFSSGANGSQGFPQGKDAAQTTAYVERGQGSYSKAHLMSPLIGYQWFLHEMKNDQVA